MAPPVALPPIEAPAVPPVPPEFGAPVQPEPRSIKSTAQRKYRDIANLEIQIIAGFRDPFTTICRGAFPPVR